MGPTPAMTKTSSAALIKDGEGQDVVFVIGNTMTIVRNLECVMAVHFLDILMIAVQLETLALPMVAFIHQE